jgi:hypothetical protein
MTPIGRIECAVKRIGYLLAIGRDRRVPTAAGPVHVDALAAGLPTRAWQRLSAGLGAKGCRYHDWVRTNLDSAHTTDEGDTGC